MVNLGLLVASLALVVSVLWLIVAFVVARTDLQRAVGHGSVPAEALAQAAIDTQQARGYEVLNLISRSGDTTFVKDFQAVRARLGPGPGTLLAAAASSSSGAGARWAAAAARDVQAWYAVIGQVYALDGKAQYTTETALVIGPGRGRLDRGIRPGRGRPVPGDRRRPRGLPLQRDGGPERLHRPRRGDHRRRGADGRRVRLGPVPPARGVPVSAMTALLSRDQAAAAVEAAVAERDTIQANLLDLDNSFGKRLLAGRDADRRDHASAGTPPRRT